MFPQYCNAIHTSVISRDPERALDEQFDSSSCRLKRTRRRARKSRPASACLGCREAYRHLEDYDSLVRSDGSVRPVHSWACRREKARKARAMSVRLDQSLNIEIGTNCISEVLNPELNSSTNLFISEVETSRVLFNLCENCVHRERCPNAC